MPAIHADVAEESRDSHTFRDNQPEDGSGFSSQGFSDAEFVRAFADGNQHDVAHSYDAAEQGKDSDYPDGSMQDLGGRLLLQVLCKAVPYPDGSFVGRRELFLQP